MDLYEAKNELCRRLYNCRVTFGCAFSLDKPDHIHVLTTREEDIQVIRNELLGGKDEFMGHPVQFYLKGKPVETEQSPME